MALSDHEWIGHLAQGIDEDRFGLQVTIDGFDAAFSSQTAAFISFDVRADVTRRCTSDLGIPLVKHPHVAKVALTGGEAGGLAVYKLAAEGLKHVSLELGGKSPNIIFDDAKIDNAVNGAVSGIFAATVAL